MTSEDHCPKCGAILSDETPEGLCPRCLMGIVAEAEDEDLTLHDISSPIETEGTVIGPYKLLEKIGEGGMAVVYMAEQERPLRRRVALKIIKLGMDTKRVVARFEAERQALAMMDHPNIAKVLDAGTTQAGRPYFVMELVRGVSITEYCDTNKLSTQERLDLFIAVCNAVHHAHQKGIIHRDIKPSNIMVTLHDGKPVPKVIDFGIAKAINQRLTEHTLFTRYSEMIGTPEYMSPEQAEMSGLDIDTRTDIYALGVVLYELLTGVLPFDPESLRSASYEEIQRIIREEEPLTPSTRLSALGQEARKIAESRGTDVVALAKRLHSELEWIPLMAMRKNRTRRYTSAYEFGHDIGNYLQGLPLIAGPESVLYRVRKVLQKHRLAVLTTTVVAATLLVGFVVSTYLYVRVRQAQHKVSKLEEAAEADHRLSTAQRLQAEGRYREALIEIDAYREGRNTAPKARLLHANLLCSLDRFEEAAAELDELTEGPPEIAGPAHCLLATIYIGLDPAKAEKHRRAGESLLPETAEAYSLRGMTSQDSESTLAWLSRALDLDPGHYPSRKARALASYAVEDYAAMARDAEAMIVARPKDSLGYGLRAIAKRQTGSFDEAIADHNRAIALCDIKVELAELHNQRRKTFTRMGDHKAALQDARRCLELSPDDLHYKFNVFTALFLSGEFEAAGRQYGIITQDDPRLVKQFKSWVSRFVFETLAAGMTFELPEALAGKPPFNIMEEAAEQYHACETRATLLVPRAFAQAGWSPNGKQLAYGRTDWYAWPDETQPVGAPTVYGASGIEILNLETGAIRQLAMTGKDPAWSPDGRYIVFNHVSNRSSDYCWQSGLWIASTKGGPLRQLTEDGWPIWGCESGCLYFHESGAMHQMHVDDPAGTRRRVVPSPPFSALSPDEQYVAYAEWSVVKIVQVSTGKVVATWKAPPPEGYQQIYLRWSPDGKEILIGGGHTSDLGLWSYDVEVGEAWQIFPSPAVLATPSPDKTKLAVALREHIGGIWLAELDPNLLIRESMAPALTRQEYLRQSCPRFTKAIKRGTFRPDAYAYLSSFMTKTSELGKAYYQNGQYDDALETLKSLAELRMALGAQVDFPDLALTAMSLHRLGRMDQAGVIADQLRRLHEGDERPLHRRLLYEAEHVLAGENGDLASFWGCLRDGRLDEANQRLADILPPSGGQDMKSSGQAARMYKILADAFYERGRRCKYTGGDYGDAMADYQMAAKLDPNNPRVLCDLAWLQAACPQDVLRDHSAARDNAAKACELTKWKDHRYIALMAAVYAQADDFASAVQWQSKVADLLPAQGKTEWAEDYESRLKLYRSNKRYDKGNLWSFCSGKMLGWWKFDEISGGTVNDSSGNQCTGTVVGVPKWEQSGGKIGGALVFDGSRVEVGPERLFDITDAITVTAWIKVNAFDKWWQALVTKGDSSWRLYREGDSDNLAFHCDGVRSAQEPWTTVRGQMNVNDGKWHHVAGVYDGWRIALFVDGQLDASCEASGQIQTNNYPVVIGDNAEAPGRQWSGLIDDVRIYSYALSPDEISVLYAMPAEASSQ